MTKEKLEHLKKVLMKTAGITGGQADVIIVRDLRTMTERRGRWWGMNFRTHLIHAIARHIGMPIIHSAVPHSLDAVEGRLWDGRVLWLPRHQHTDMDALHEIAHFLESKEADRHRVNFGLANDEDVDVDTDTRVESYTREEKASLIEQGLAVAIDAFMEEWTRATVANSLTFRPHTPLLDQRTGGKEGDNA